MVFSTPTTLVAQDKVPQNLPAEYVKKAYTKDELVKLVYQYAEEYKVNPKVMVNLINCEDRDWIVNQQSTQVYKPGNRWGFPAGTREKSYGLAQIHLPDNPVTYEQATDPDFSIRFMAEKLSKGRGSMWSCYK